MEAGEKKSTGPVARFSRGGVTKLDLVGAIYGTSHSIIFGEIGPHLSAYTAKEPLLARVSFSGILTFLGLVVEVRVNFRAESR